MKDKKRLIFIICGIVILLLTLLGGAYAFYTWGTSDSEKTVINTNVGSLTIYYDAGSSINSSIKPVLTKEEGVVKTVLVKASNNGAKINFYLDIASLDEGLKHSSFKYEFYKDSTLIKSGNFADEYLNSNTEECSVNTGVRHIALLSNENVMTSDTTYKLYIWIDGTVDNPSNMQNKHFNFDLHAEGVNAIIKEGKIPDISEIPMASAAYAIASKYVGAPKEEVSNNDVKYQYAPSVHMTNDIAGNIRYYGKTPNNYIYFNCDDYSNQTDSTCEAWRIIGVFGDKLKIIRNSSIEKLAWDYTYNKDGTSMTYVNDWTNASLKALLNGAYYNNQDTTYYTHDYTNNVPIAQTVNFNTNKIGIKNETTRNMISDVIWNLGGWNSSSVYSDEVYGYERGTTVYNGRSTSWKGKIALAYPSDYGYAGDFNYCTTNLYKYYDYEASAAGENPSTLCRENDWMYTGYWYWLLTPYSSSDGAAWVASGNGYVGDWHSVGTGSAIRPVLYLNTDISISSVGDGSSSNPYQILIK